MAIGAKPDIDPLILHTLRYPMLTELFRSYEFKAIMVAYAEEIRRNYLTRVPRDTGNLASTAKVTAHRSKIFKDQRWESEFSVGGPRAPYALAVEEEVHALAEAVLASGHFLHGRGALRERP